MRVKVLIPFFDLQEGVARKPGDTFTVSEERYGQLIYSRFGILVEKVTEKTEEAKPKKKPAAKKG